MDQSPSPESESPSTQTPSRTPPADRPERWPVSARSGWLAAGTFVVGLLAGALITGLLGQDPPVQPSGQAAMGAVPTAGMPTAYPGAGGEQLSEACLRAINAAQDIAVAVEDVGTAAAALDAAQLDEAIRQVQPLQARLQAATAECSPVPGTSPVGTPAESPSTPPTSPTG